MQGSEATQNKTNLQYKGAGPRLYGMHANQNKSSTRPKLQSDSNSARRMNCFVLQDLHTMNLSMDPDRLERSRNYLSNEYSNTQNRVHM